MQLADFQVFIYFNLCNFTQVKSHKLLLINKLHFTTKLPQPQAQSAKHALTKPEGAKDITTSGAPKAEL